jgi:hypothetical protein
LPAIQNFTADRMSLVTPPNSNGWTIPLRNVMYVRFSVVELEWLFWIRILKSFRILPLTHSECGELHKLT